jgi:hypothetical protein
MRHEDLQGICEVFKSFLDVMNKEMFIQLIGFLSNQIFTKRHRHFLSHVIGIFFLNK